MAERILVIGAGIGGLCLALALSPQGRQVTLLERDGAPPEGGADEAFFHWSRRGVGHLRHSHAFLARLRNIIKDHHPALLQQLLDAGAREIGFADMLPAALKADYRPEPGDEDMAVLTSRRTTLERVIRGYVETLPNATIVGEAFVRGLIIEKGDEGQLRVLGVSGDLAGEPSEWRADVTIDAGGKLEYPVAGAGGLLFVNGEARREIVRIDTATNKVTAHWPMPDAMVLSRSAARADARASSSFDAG
jgi:2-polyprenyl-6-methoxyphenol hydroxylase-like FAD-dependent oxidoreductase